MTIRWIDGIGFSIGVVGDERRFYIELRNGRWHTWDWLEAQLDGAPICSADTRDGAKDMSAHLLAEV